MPFSLFELAQRIERQASEHRNRRRIAEIQADPHLSRDLGLPFRPHTKKRTELW